MTSVEHLSVAGIACTTSGSKSWSPASLWTIFARFLGFDSFSIQRSCRLGSTNDRTNSPIWSVESGTDVEDLQFEEGVSARPSAARALETPQHFPSNELKPGREQFRIFDGPLCGDWIEVLSISSFHGRIDPLLHQ